MKLNRIKLFENCSNMGVLIVQADFSEITMGEPDEWLNPSMFNVTYHTNPSEELIERAYASENFTTDLITPDHISEEIFSGDQNGTNLSQSEGKEMVLLTDGTYQPENYEEAIKSGIDFLNKYPNVEEDYCFSILSDEGEQANYTPEFLAHCRALVADSSMAQKLISNYPEMRRFIEGPKKIMEPRIKFTFNVM